MQLAHPVVCIVGPTASGKSDVAQRVALELGGEVVSADSMQVYRGMDIGTGKVSAEQRMVPHFGLDLVDPGEPYSAALFQEYARKCFVDIDSRGKRVLLCGGTGFYVRAAIDDYDFPAGEQVGNVTRERYNAVADDWGAAKLWQLLRERDPDSAAIIPVNDVKRLVRAFELLDNGTSYAQQKAKLATIRQRVPAIMVGLFVEPDVLRERIDRRVDAMIEAGLVQEVQGLLDAGLREGVTAPQAIGYKEIVAAIDGKISLDEARDRIKLATRRYAKRQRTWFRKDARITWLDATAKPIDDVALEALDVIMRNDGGSRASVCDQGTGARLHHA